MGQGGSENLALNKMATCLSYYPGFPPGEAVDGLYTVDPNRWASGTEDPNWLCVDLGAVYTIQRVVIAWENAYADEYKIQVSDDAATWTDVYYTAAGAGGTVDIDLDETRWGRYVRVYCIHGVYWLYSIWELSVYGGPAIVTTEAMSLSGDYTAVVAIDIFEVALTDSLGLAEGFEGSASQEETKEIAVADGFGMAEGLGQTLRDDNLALYRPVVASSSYTTFGPERLTDGLPETYWSSDFAEPQWVYVDIGELLTVRRIVLYWHEYWYGTSYAVQISRDAEEWTTIYETESGVGGTEDIVMAGAVASRYVRVYGVTRATEYSFALHEIEVYGGGVMDLTDIVGLTDGVEAVVWDEPEVEVTDTLGVAELLWVECLSVEVTDILDCADNAIASLPEYDLQVVVSDALDMVDNEDPVPFASNFALGKTAVASSIYSAGYAASYATDGDLYNRWASAEGVDPQWIYVDLGAAVAFSEIVLRWEAAYGKSYQIQVSNNAVDWTPVYSTTAGDGGVDDIFLATPATARYVRMYGTERGTPWGYSLYEFEVYGPVVTSGYYVSPSGNDANLGTSVSAPWRTIAKANATLQPGDTVYIRAGNYAEGINPTNNGTAGAPITYMNYPGEDPMLLDAPWWGVTFTNKQYIIVDGIDIRGAYHGWADFYGAQHCSLKNAVCTRPGHGYGMVEIWGGAAYNQIIGCSFSHYEWLQIPEWGYEAQQDSVLFAGNSRHTLVEGNFFSYTSHGPCGSYEDACYVVVRNNIFENKWHGGCAAAYYDTYPPTGYWLVENNIFRHCGTEYYDCPKLQDASHPFIDHVGMQWGPGLLTIIRRNVYWDCGTGITMGGYFDTQLIHLYHCTFYRCVRQLGSGPFYWNGRWRGILNNTFFNNISFDHVRLQTDATHIYDADIEMWMDPSAVNYPNHWENNIIADILDTGAYKAALIKYGNLNPYLGVSATEAMFPTEWLNNIEANPLFVNGPAGDFTLQAGSPAISAGRHLTLTTNSGTNSTVLTVGDAGFFFSGEGSPWEVPGTVADTIYIEGSGPVTIASINYGTNTIYLTNPMTWTYGKKVYDRAFSGSAPDIGAYEYGSVVPTETLHIAVTDWVGVGDAGLFRESFEEDIATVTARWVNYNGSGELSIQGVTGSKYLRVGDGAGNDMLWYILGRSLPFDPAKLYRMRIVVRRTLGIGAVFAGIAGRDATDTLWVNVNGADLNWAQHYICADGVEPGAAWTEYIGYFQGTATPGSPEAHPSADDSGKLHTNVAFIRPLVILNYANEPGTMELDEITIDNMATAQVITMEYLAINVTDTLGLLDAGRDTFRAAFDDPAEIAEIATRWLSYRGSGEMSVVSGALRAGNNAGDDERWLIYWRSFAFDPDQLYRVRIRARRTAGAGALYCGVAGRNAADDAFVNINGNDDVGSQHYICAVAAVPGTDWTDYTGYFQGHDALGSWGPNPSPASPGKLQTNAAYFRPISVLNYASAAGVMEVDEISILALPGPADVCVTPLPVSVVNALDMSDNAAGTIAQWLASGTNALSLSDNVTVNVPGLEIHAADTLSLAESRAVQIPELRVQVSNGLNLSMNLAARIPILRITVSNSLSLGMNVTPFLPLLAVGVSNTLSLAASLTLSRTDYGTVEPGTTNSMAMGESLLARLTPLQVNVTDSLSMGDADAARLTLFTVAVSDTLSLEGAGTPWVPIVPVVTSQHLSMADSVAAEIPLLEIEVTNRLALVADRAAARIPTFQVIVTDALDVTDNATAWLPALAVGAADTLGLADTAQPELPLLFVWATDGMGMAESFLPGRREIVATDGLGLTEGLVIRMPGLEALAVEAAGLAETIAVVLDRLEVAVSEAMSIADSPAVYLTPLTAVVTDNVSMASVPNTETNPLQVAVADSLGVAGHTEFAEAAMAAACFFLFCKRHR